MSAAMLAFLPLCALGLVAGLVAVTGAAHLRAPSGFSRLLSRHGLLPGALVEPAAWAVALGELAIAAAAAAALAAGDRRLASAVLAVALVAGLGFLAYLRRLVQVGDAGSCGCTPFEAPLSSASFVPAAALAVSGALGGAASLAGHGPLAPAADPWGALAVAWGLLLAVLVTLLPASVPGGEPGVGEEAR